MKIALVGIGKIARDQHIPSIAASPDWELAATVSRSGTVDGVAAYTDFAEFLGACPEVSVVSLCLPPVPRFAYAKAALEAGRHVMLEKPPGATLAEVHALCGLAAQHRRSLFCTWHSRMAPGVGPARAFLSGRKVTSGRITWREDVRRWHPGQDWVFDPGGMGVFDPGINALSILTEILPDPFHLIEATLLTPEGRQTPIAAAGQFSNGVIFDFDWRQEHDQKWEIEIMTTQGSVLLQDGGDRLSINGVPQDLSGRPDEYPALYQRMDRLVAEGESDTDLNPMVHVSDAMTLGRREWTAAFDF